MTQTKLIIILSAILLAVVIGSGVLIFLSPSSTPKTDTAAVTNAPVATDTATATSTTAPSTSSSGSFNTGVFQKSGYVTLDRQMIQDGRLPVQPPANTGKANPFL